MATAKKAKRWVVPIEATVTGYVVVDAISADDAVDVTDQLIEDNNFGLTDDGPAIDLAVFERLVDKGQVTTGMAVEPALPYRAPRKRTTAKKKIVAKKTTTKKTTTKGRSRGGAAATKKKTTTAKKKTTTAKNPAGTKKKVSAGRKRGGNAKS